jgi:tetratricopeptide (TPR) repeat protein
MEQAPQECRALELSGRILYLRGLQAASSGGGGGGGAGGEGDQAAAAAFIAQAHDRYLAAIECQGAPPAGLHQSAGEIAAAAGRLDAALDHFRAAGTLDPLDPKHPLYEAQMLMKLGRTAEAAQAIDRVLAIDPGEPFAHATLASASLEARDCTAAIGHIEAARRLAPADLAIRIHEASIRRRCDQPRQGLELLVGLDEPTRSQEIVTAEIAECFRALGQPASAAAAWEARYRLNPRDPSAWQSASRAADAHLEAGNREAARWWQAAAAAARAPGR